MSERILLGDALDKLGVDVTAYYATEIDKYAIKTTETMCADDFCSYGTRKEN